MSRVVDAEQAVLGGVMLVPESYWRINTLLTPDDFTRRDHALIWRAMGDFAAAGRPMDSVTLGEWFEAEGLSSLVGNGAYLVDLHSNTPSAANVTAYAEIVAQAGERRRVQQAGRRIAQAESYAEAATLLAEASPRTSSRIKSVKDGASEMVDALQRRFDADGSVTGIPTGLESLDALTAGWQPGSLNILAGRPSMGKTAFAVQSAIAADRVMFLSLEMPAGQLVERAVCNIGGIPYRWFLFPKDAPDYAMERISAATAQVMKLRMSFDDRAGITLDAIEAVVKQAHMLDPLKLIVVDHLGLVARPGKHDPSELGAITSGLKRIAKEVAPVLLLAQLNRSLESRNDKRPMLSDLRDSGRIEEDADTVIGLYRESYYTKNTDPSTDYLEAIVLKNRNGEKGTAWGLARLGHMRIESADEPAGQVEQVGGGGGFASRGGKGGQPQARPAIRGFGGYGAGAGG